VKILVIVHQFPPQESAGTEVYAWKLAKELQRRGHVLTVYYTQRDPERKQYSLRRGSFDGLPFFEVVNNHEFTTFRSTWKDARMEEHLASILEEVQPDVVHVQHLHLHSIGYLERIHARRIPIVYTLAEYLNICPRNGWMVKLDFSLCAGPELGECARCARGIWPAPSSEEVLTIYKPVSVPPPSEPYRRYSWSRFLRKVQRRIGVENGHPEPAPPTFVEEQTPRLPDDLDPYLPGVELRWREIKEGLANVDLFIAPSRFLLERFVDAGMVAPERILHSDYGFDHQPFERAPGAKPAGTSPRSENLVVGFIGSVAEQKGVHLLIEAMNRLPEQGIECQIWGGLSSFPEYVAMLRDARAHLGVRFMGRYANDRIAEVLRGLDVLVVPSRWYENSPLTIHEAFMAGIPVITGDQGGMAELVQHEKNGLCFRVGDSIDLGRQLQRLMQEPDLLARLRAGIPPVKDIAEDAREMEERFTALLRGSPRAAPSQSPGHASCA
jgi:glycosyltransferase involved in cell wall biosynthesis